MDNFEMVEKLVGKFGISYADAKAALEGANWDMLDAVMALEAQGKIKSATGTYTTGASASAQAAAPAAATVNAIPVAVYSPADEAERQRKAAEAQARKARRDDLLARIKNLFLNNHVLVKNKNGKTLVRVPLIAAVVVGLLFFWILIFAILIAFLMGCQLVFEGAELGTETVNKAAKAVSDTVADLGQDLKEKVEETHAKKDSDSGDN